MLDAKIKKPAFENLMNYSRRRTDFLRRVSIFLLVSRKWIPGVASVSENGVAVMAVAPCVYLELVTCVCLESVACVCLELVACVFRVGVKVIP